MSSGKVHIVTDSTCDLDPPLLREHGIHMVPLNVHFGAETFKDRVDLMPPEFFRRLESGGPHPTTSQPSPRDFQDVYERLLDQGGEIVSLQVSSKMSGTWQSAVLAQKELASDRIHVVDTRSTSVGLGAIVLECARAAAAGRTAAEVTALASHLAVHTRLLFVVETLEYLQKGGRIGMAAALIGGLLNIKPILELREGIVCPLERVRGTRKAQARLISLIGEYVAANPGRELRAAITWARDSQSLEALIPGLNQHLDCSRALRSEIGAVVGTHVGPGTVGVSVSLLPPSSPNS